MLYFFRRCRILSNLQRCNQLNRIKSYSVADHCYHCGLLAFILCDYENSKNGVSINTNEVLHRVMLHDLPEALTGDILYPTKHFNKNITECIRQVEKEVTDKQLFAEIPEVMARRYCEYIENAKDKSIEGRMVAAVDKLEILLFALEELEMGNRAFVDLFGYVIKHISDREYYGFESIKKLVNEVKRTVIPLMKREPIFTCEEEVIGTIY